MTLLGVWVAAGLGLVLTFRAARLLAGSPAAWLSTAALLFGQFLTVAPTAREAIAFAIAALAVERAQALRQAGRRLISVFPLALAVVPAAGAAAYGLGWPAPGRMLDVLFCSQHGIAATSAVVWLGLVGFIWDAAKAPRLGALWLFSFLLVVLAASGPAHDGLTWREAAGVFGAAMPLVGVGVALLGRRLLELTARRPAWAAAALLAPLVAWNVTLAAVAHAGTLRIGEAVSFETIGAAQARTAHQWVGHPLAFPGSLTFSLRTGLPMWRFDPLGSAHVDASRPVAIDVGTADAGYLGAGWHAAERDGGASFRWASARAELLVPHLPAGPVRVRVHLRPFLSPAAPAQTATVLMGDQPIGPIALDAAWSWIEVDADVPAGAPSVIRMALVFGHATSPAKAGQGGDTRELSAMVDRLEIVVRR